MFKSNCFLIVILCSFSSSYNSSDKHSIDFLHQYERGFTILVLGDNSIEKGLLLAKTFPNASVVIISKQEIKKDSLSENICLLSFVPNLYYLNLMSENEHFDVIFFLSKNLDNSLFETLKSMSDYIIFESDNVLQMQPRGLREKSYEFENNLFLFKTENSNILKNRTLVWPPPYIQIKKKNYAILSDFKSKRLKKYFVNSPDKLEIEEWKKGINLLTFLFFNGTIPSRKYINNKLDELKTNKIFSLHADLTPANLIIDGNVIIAIDYGNSKKPHPSFEQKFNFSKKMIEDTSISLDYSKFYHYYWENSTV